VEAEGDASATQKEYSKQIKKERTGGSNTFTLPPSAASIFKYVSSSVNYTERDGMSEW
jgi:hypothetical protein